MANEKIDVTKETETKKTMEFDNIKAAFVAGIAVIITVLNDTVGLLVSIPFWIEAVEVIICLLLFFMALATNKMDKLLSKNKEGVEKFGSFLTVYSIIIFLLEKILKRSVDEEVITCSLSSEKFWVFIFFLLLAIVGIWGAIHVSHKSDK